MNFPMPKNPDDFLARRRRELKLTELDWCLADIVSDRNYDLDALYLLKSFQAALTIRQGFIDIESPEHKKLQQYVNQLEKIISNEVPA